MPATVAARDLNAYIAAGIRTEHEATTAEEATEKLRKGMRVLIREGSVSKDLEALQPVLTDITAPYMCLCTDDRNPLDIADQGHLDYMIRQADPEGHVAAGRPIAPPRFRRPRPSGWKDRGPDRAGACAPISCAVDSLEGCHAQLVMVGGRVADADAFAARQDMRAGRAGVGQGAAGGGG